MAGPASRPRVIVCGTLRTVPATPHAERLAGLAEGIARVIAEHEPREAAIESWFVHPVSRSAMGMAEARGAILAAIAAAGVAVTEHSPNTVKQSVAGYGGADKEQVRLMVARQTGAAAGSSHAADAIAVAICHMTSEPLRRAIRRSR